MSMLDAVSATGEWTLDGMRRRAIATLTAARVASPEADADALIGHVLGLSRGELHLKIVLGTLMDVADAHRVCSLVEARASRVPLQHITRVAAFRRIELAVGPGVFVPRPETESVAQLAIDALLEVPGAEPIAVDLGTGSGAIALALATEVPHARVFAAENSPQAFIWARRNFRELADDRARLAFIGIADAYPELNDRVDVVVSNPPYIPLGAIPRDPEVRLHDPEAALYGGPDGLEVVREVSTTARRLLRPGGRLVIEHGDAQGEVLRELLLADGWRSAATHRDLLGRDRAATAIR